METIASIRESFALYPLLDSGMAGLLCESFADASAQRLFDLQEKTGADFSVLSHGAAETFSSAGMMCWSPELGRVNELTGHGEPFGKPALAQLALALAACGWRGEFETLIPVKTKILAGPLQLDCCGKTRVVATGTSVEISTEDARCRLRRDGDLLMPEEEGYLCGVMENGARIALVGGYNIDPEVLQQEDWPLGRDAFAAASGCIAEAFDLLSRSGDAARQWVVNVVRRLALISVRDGQRHTSRSSGQRPGCVVLSAPADPVILAEALIHEASHQYYFLATRLGPYARSPADEEILYYSAINGKQRTLPRLLLALHAVANMDLFLDSIIETPGPIGASALRRLRDFAPVGNSLASTIGRNLAGLAPDARGMADRLIETASAIGEKYGIAEGVA